MDDIANLSARGLARRLTLLAQQRPTPSGITVGDLVEFGRYPHRSKWSGRDDGATTAVSRALDLAGLTELRAAPLDSLSGGQLQRAWIASALAQDTEILLLDEPTNHLDLRYQVEVLDLIRALADEHGVAVGAVLHDLNQAAAVADRIVMLSEGRVVADNSPAAALDPELLSKVYGLPITVVCDSATGSIDVRPVRSGRKTSRLDRG